MGSQSLRAHVARSAAVVTHLCETSNVGAGIDAEGLVNLFLTIDGQLVQGAGSAIGVLGVHSINCTLSDGVVTGSQLFSSFQTCGCTLDGTLNGFHVGSRGEAGSAIGCTDNSGDDGLHDEGCVLF